MAEQDARRIGLNLTATYAPMWGTWEGVRELVQNWHDGVLGTLDALRAARGGAGSRDPPRFERRDDGLSFEAFDGAGESLGRLTFDAEQQALRMTNYDVGLARKVLLLGFSAKAEHRDVVGAFGEGLKVGALALLRRGLELRMDTRDERWRFGLATDEAFDERVLTVFVTSREAAAAPPAAPPQLERQASDAREQDTKTVLSNLTADEWAGFIPRFLFLAPSAEAVATPQGTLLLDDRCAGQMYVKGIWISDLRDVGLAAGADFREMSLDRDRMASVRQSDVEHQLATMWLAALRLRSDLVPRYWQLLNEGRAVDVKHVAFYATDEDAQMFAAHFASVYGEGALPVGRASGLLGAVDAMQAQLDRTLVACPDGVLELLMKSGLYPSAEELLAAQAAARVRVVPVAELPEAARSVLHHACGLVAIADPLFAPHCVDVIEHSPVAAVATQDGRVRLPLEILTARGESHEAVAHVALALLPAGASVEGIVAALSAQACGEAQAHCAALHPDVSAPSAELRRLVDRERALRDGYEARLADMRADYEGRLESARALQAQLAELRRTLAAADTERFNVEQALRKEFEGQLAAARGAAQQRAGDGVLAERDARAAKQRAQALRQELADAVATHKRQMDAERRRVQQYRTALVQRAEQLQGLSAGGGDDDVLEGIRQLIADERARDVCCVCLDAQVSVALVPCGHRAFCGACADALQRCAICRAGVQDRLRTF